MKRELRIAAVMIASIAAAIVGAESVAGQICMQSTGSCADTRLYPKSANPDGSLNCAPKCGLIGPCC